MKEVLNLIPGYELANDAEKYIMNMRSYKGKHLVITLQKGEVVSVRFCRTISPKKDQLGHLVDILIPPKHDIKRKWKMD